MATFFLAMLKYPEVQAKAQSEIDAALGPGTLPSFGDEDALPYLTAIVKECLRWEVVVPLAVPHLASADHEYNGYHIRAGALVAPNTWHAPSNHATAPR